MFTKPELIEKILDIGLQHDERNLYHHNYLNRQKPVGMWQSPDELADMIIFLQNKNIQSFLNIGTFNGITFNFVSDCLNQLRKTKCVTLDAFDHNPVKNKNYRYEIATSDNWAGKDYDFVFIDGDHSYNWAKKDYENSGKLARICGFHDVVDVLLSGFPPYNGGVPRFWSEISKSYKSVLFDCPKKPIKIMGIGLIEH